MERDVVLENPSVFYYTFNRKQLQISDVTKQIRIFFCIFYHLDNFFRAGVLNLDRQQFCQILPVIVFSGEADLEYFITVRKGLRVNS